MEYTADEYRVYLKVKKALLMEDVKFFIKEYLALKNDCAPWEIEDEQTQEYDYEYLVNEYAERESAEWAYNDTWESIVNDYMEALEDYKNE